MNNLSMPDIFFTRIQKILALHDPREVLEKFNYIRPVSIRVNTLKSTVEEVRSILHRVGIVSEAVSWWKKRFGNKSCICTDTHRTAII